MINTRFEEYKGNTLPFVLNDHIKRTSFIFSKEQNWHEDVELQLCLSGSGTVLLNGERYPFEKGDIIVANSNVIHHTGTDGELVYTCLIISPDFIKKIQPGGISFSPIVKSDTLPKLIGELTEIYYSDDPFKTAKLYGILLKIFIDLAENHSVQTVMGSDGKVLERIKTAINHIRLGYASRITLDTLGSRLCCDKYALCRDFKRITGMTVTEYVNRYRCRIAAEHLQGGKTVSETAYLCGFENPSFFTKTYKKYMGALPSETMKKKK